MSNEQIVEDLVARLRALGLAGVNTYVRIT